MVRGTGRSKDTQGNISNKLDSISEVLFVFFFLPRNMWPREMTENKYSGYNILLIM